MTNKGKTKAMWSDNELAKCEPVGKRLLSVGHELGRFKDMCFEFGGVITAAQAAYILGVSHERVRQLGIAGQIRSEKILGVRYYSVKDVDKRMSARMDEVAAEKGGIADDLREVWSMAIKDGREERKLAR